MSATPSRAAASDDLRPRPMRRRGIILGAVLLLINLPGAMALIEAVTFYASNRSTGFITVAGQKRGYVLHVPRSHDQSRRVPLVISLHGGGLWGAAQRDISQWNTVANREGFIVAYPSGAGRMSPRAWGLSPGPRLLQDADFISRLIDTLSASYSIDPDRVYVNGLSNGGGMTFFLSCTLSDRIAAAGMVAAAHMLSWDVCGDRRPVPLIAFHGTADSAVPYEGGKSWVSPHTFPNLPAWVGTWAERNGCAEGPTDSAVAPDVTRRAYTRCVNDADVVLFTVHGGGHSWPGGKPVPEWLLGSTTRSIDASSEMWAFFRERRLRR